MYWQKNKYFVQYSIGFVCTYSREPIPKICVDKYFTAIVCQRHISFVRRNTGPGVLLLRA